MFSVMCVYKIQFPPHLHSGCSGKTIKVYFISYEFKFRFLRRKSIKNFYWSL